MPTVLYPTTNCGLGWRWDEMSIIQRVQRWLWLFDVDVKKIIRETKAWNGHSSLVICIELYCIRSVSKGRIDYLGRSCFAKLPGVIITYLLRPNTPNHNQGWNEFGSVGLIFPQDLPWLATTLFRLGLTWLLSSLLFCYRRIGYCFGLVNLFGQKLTSVPWSPAQQHSRFSSWSSEQERLPLGTIL